MKAPPLLLGATLLFWGWQSGFVVPAAIMALTLEGSRVVKLRWDLSSSDFNRISDLCSLLFLGMVIYIYASKRSAPAILLIFQWLPMAVFPLLAAQVYSAAARIDFSTFFWSLRKKAAKEGKTDGKTVDLSYPYFGLSILAASAANVRSYQFYAGVFMLACWALWPSRSRRFSPVLWGILLVVAGFTGYAGQKGLHNLQLTLERKTLDWFTGLMQREADPYRARTAMGDIGTLKLSDRIAFRVVPGFEPGNSFVMREASYNLYTSSGWFALHSRFTDMHPERDGNTWELQVDGKTARMVTVLQGLRGGRDILKLPAGASRITQLPVLKMRQNQFGAVKVEDGPGFVTYGVLFDPHETIDSPPDETDLQVPANEMPAISLTVQELGLKSGSPTRVLQTLKAFFRKNFTYSLVLKRPGYHSTPVSDFLTGSRSGHCEYFATATVLLLRAAGIPARYGTGYSVHEFSRMENSYVVRKRHAHAWALVYVDGAWQDFDTTPPAWTHIEDESASIWEPMFDLWSFFMLKISQWRWEEREGGMAGRMWWLLIPLGALLAWRLYRKKRVGGLRKEEGREYEKGFVQGADSEFYLIEKKLSDAGYARRPWEGLAEWIERVERAEESPVSSGQLGPILALHYRYRFDPAGITAAEKEALTTGVHSWLEKEKGNKANTFKLQGF